jgi:hypothetical protein
MPPQQRTPQCKFPSTSQRASQHSKKTIKTHTPPPSSKRTPEDQSTSISDATPTPVAHGIRGAPPGEEAKGYTQEDYSRKNELDAEQMAAPGEGKIADAVEEKPGASGKQPGLESDLDKKKAEQAPAREKIEAEKQENVDVAGVLGQRGGPASTVD